VSAPLDVKGLAEHPGVSVDWVYTQVEAGSIPCTRLPGKSKTGARRLIRFTTAHVAEILDEGDHPAVIVPPVSLARARALRAAKNDPPPDPKPEPKPADNPRGTPAPKGPGTPRQPRGPGRHNDG